MLRREEYRLNSMDSILVHLESARPYEALRRLQTRPRSHVSRHGAA